MDFNLITKLVAQRQELPEDADLIDQYAFHTLEIIYAQFKANYISQETATRRKEKLMREYEKQKEQQIFLRNTFDRQVKYINETEQLRVKLNKASEKCELTVELWLDAIKCIGALCGCYSAYESCKQYVENYEEQIKLEVQ